MKNVYLQRYTKSIFYSNLFIVLRIWNMRISDKIIKSKATNEQHEWQYNHF